MAYFEPTVVIFGSPQTISTISLRVPVQLLFIFDEAALEQLIRTNPKLDESCLQRYFIALFDPLSENLMRQVNDNHRVVAVYEKTQYCLLRQFTLDLTNDIVRFLTAEGEKQIRLERIPLAKVYYQEARTLKEWAMSLFKAEPCHILLIPLNSSQANLDSAQQRLQKVCDSMGCTSVIIRQLNDYIPHTDKHISLLPYDNLLFANEHPNNMCQRIKNLSPIRFYLYGNESSIQSEWSKLMISTETDVMQDEDNWCAFLENERVQDDVKWNFAFTCTKEWKVSRVAPTDFSRLHENPRFHSALRRAFITFADRQIEVTAEIFDWYEICISTESLQRQPKLAHQDQNRKTSKRKGMAYAFRSKGRFQDLSSFNYAELEKSKNKSVAFIWLDEMLTESPAEFDRLIEPFQWTFFTKIPICLAFIETQLREQRYVFLVVSGSLGNELFLTNVCLIKQLFATYVYCAHLSPNFQWTEDNSTIRGVFNDQNQLLKKIQMDLDPFKQSSGEFDSIWYNSSKTTDQITIPQSMDDTESLLPLPISVYSEEQKHVFLGHQRTIDTILCMPHTDESKLEMIAEFQRLYSHNETILAEIEYFQNEYYSSAAVRWYTRDSFVSRTINRTLRESNVDAMFKLRYILSDICDHLDQSHQHRYWLRALNEPLANVYYRGQLMSLREFEGFQRLRGNIISVNTFLSTTSSMQVALMFSSKFHGSSNLVSVVFRIETDSRAKTRPYADISKFSKFPDEAETLFGMGSVFQVGNIPIDFSPKSAMSKQYEHKCQPRNKRRIDSYRQYTNDYQDNRQESYYFNNDQQWEMSSLDEYQFDPADQADECTPFDEPYHTNEEFYNSTTTRRQMSTYADINRNPSCSAFNQQQSCSDVSTNCKLVSSKSRFTIENINRQIATVRNSVLKNLYDELKVLFHEKVPELFGAHEALIRERLALQEEEDDGVKFSKQTIIQELKDQLDTFVRGITTLSECNPTTVEHHQQLVGRLKREIQRLKARLPIYARRDELVSTISDSYSKRVIIVKGDTGSGKSSQLIQYLADAGLAGQKQIVCTQPRRLAARELAARVAKEFGCQLGEEVGCQVGSSQPQISNRTKMCFVTDSVLLNEYQTDPTLNAYSIVIIDEAHERRVDTDLLFGAMKLCIQRRFDIRLIIMSATLDEKLLINYFDGEPMIEIPGRIFPIEDIYAMEDAENHVDEAINKVLEIHRSQPPGDILVFLTGQDEIDRAIDEVTRSIDAPESAIVLPLHGKLNEDETRAAFMPTNNKQQRKIIFSTNVAETSVTIEGIRYVVDSGMVKEAMWDSKRRMRVLKIGYTTQSSVRQRRGRAGRTSAGKVKL
ncbi:unnamed protein product [Adineta ricciae]|uniref:Uncharacterized protein n=1 Tax=Adineta ricciae TaxID=249248 RepID=A0A814YL43_ADIRI|nr:unnamed protein product [Adineta ricciae]